MTLFFPVLIRAVPVTVRIGLVLFLINASCQTGIAQDPKPSAIVSFDAQVTFDQSLTRALVKETIVIKVGVGVGAGADGEGKGEPSVPLQAVPFGDATLQNLVVESVSAKPVELTRTDGLWQANVSLALSEAATVELRLTYEVTSAQPGFHVPLVYPPWKPAALESGSQSDLFTATVSFPTGLRLVESFPTQSLPGPGDEINNQRSFELSAIPSVLWFQFADEADGTLGTGAIIDIGVVMILCLLSLVGWKFRRFLV